MTGDFTMEYNLFPLFNKPSPSSWEKEMIKEAVWGFKGAFENSDPAGEGREGLSSRGTARAPRL